MPTVPSEPEKYSIDEMMDRLKNVPSENPEDGEMVTRSDGSQAIRVRKRKRRSTQPHKEQAQQTRRTHVMQVSAALVCVFLAALTIGGAIIYANSGPFRENLVRKIALASGASIELEQFRMNPKTANAGKLTLEWPGGNVLKSLTLHGITAEISPSSFLGKSMNGEEITVADGTLVLQIPKPGQALRSSAEPAGDLPVQFNRYHIPRFDLTLGEPASAAIKLTKSEASLYPENKSGRVQMRLNQGNLAITGWPKLRLDRALIEFRGNQTDIIVLRFFHETDDRGVFEISGTVSPYKPDHLSTLAVQLEAFELSGITGPSLGRLFSGRVDSLPVAESNYFSFLPSANPTPTLDVSFRTPPGSSIEVQGFPFLFALAQTLDDEWFERPVFAADAGGVLHREAGTVTLGGLNFESKGRMALRGGISMASNQTLSGNLQLGIAEAMIVSAKNPRLKSMFAGLPNEGFHWITLKIGGTATSPTDNFGELFSATAAAPRNPPAPAENKGSTFEELTRPK